MTNSKDPKQIMEEGWKAREAFNFAKANKLLTQAKKLFQEKADWYNVTETLNHLAYTKKLKAAEIVDKGLKQLKNAARIAKKNQTKDILILRAQMSLLETKGNFEAALKISQKLLEQSEKPNVKADVLSHMATFTMRTGNLEKAQQLIEDAENLMNNTEEFENEPFRSIWLCRILLTKALILYNKGEMDEAKKTAKKALDLAKEKELFARQMQAESVLDLFRNKN